MPRLPQPSTTSPGFIVLNYTAASIPHKVSVRIIHDVDITAIDAMRTAATELATAMKHASPSSVVITSWELQNPDRLELFSEPFETVMTGDADYGSLSVSESATLDVPGRGNPTIGLAQGNTRFMWFLGGMNVIIWGNARFVPATGSPLLGLIAALNNSTVYGADFYGTKAVYQQYVDTQLNAHFQKRYGL